MHVTMRTIDTDTPQSVEGIQDYRDALKHYKRGDHRSASETGGDEYPRESDQVNKGYLPIVNGTGSYPSDDLSRKFLPEVQNPTALSPNASRWKRTLTFQLLQSPTQKTFTHSGWLDTQRHASSRILFSVLGTQDNHLSHRLLSTPRRMVVSGSPLPLGS